VDLVVQLEQINSLMFIMVYVYIWVYICMWYTFITVRVICL
jgi:hypothetical protein